MTSGLATRTPEPGTHSPPDGVRLSGRIDAVDAARACALAAMAAYHATWDLGFLNLTPVNYALTPAGRTIAHLIAGSFLTLVGIGLVLMNRHGIRWRPFWKRLARIGGAALLITIATRIAFPDNYIFFGVLHCIAASSLLALPFLFLPPALTALAAAAVIAATFLVRHPALDANALFFLGLGSRLPETNDWVPLFPWFGIVLAGVALGRIGLPALARSRLGRWRASGRAGRAATFAGRHSLAIYLAHQPVLLALLYGLVSLTGPHPKAGQARLMADLALDCGRAGSPAQTCHLASRCTLQALIREGLWTADAGISQEGLPQARQIWRACHAAAEGTVVPP